MFFRKGPLSAIALLACSLALGTRASGEAVRTVTASVFTTSPIAFLASAPPSTLSAGPISFIATAPPSTFTSTPLAFIAAAPPSTFTTAPLTFDPTVKR